jgi:cytochrome c oxidase subunit 1
MTLTESRPSAGVPARAGDVARPILTEEPAGLAGWLVTGDHKRIGRLYIATALLFLVAGTAIGAVVGAERVDSGLQVFDDAEMLRQIHSLHGSVSVFLFLVPVLLGLATYVVPLQVGAANVAFPRLSALSFWGYLVSGGILIAAYAADGGPGGGDADAVDLWLVALAGLTASTVIALISVLTTIVVLRAPGMTLLRAPAFSWSVLVGGGLTLLAAPVLVATLAVLFIAHHHGGGEPPGGQEITWFFGLPQVYLLVVPVAGIAAEIVPVLARVRPVRSGPVAAVIAALALFGFGAFAQPPGVIDEPAVAVVTIAAVLPALALLAVLADTLRRGGRPAVASPLLFAMGAVLLLFLGALAGGAAVIDPLDLEGTTWVTGQLHLVLLGAGVLGAFAGLSWWAPKIWGAPLGEWPARVAFLLTFLGVLLVAGPDLVTGLVNDLEPAAADFDDDSLNVTMNVVAEIGAGVVILGVLAFVAAVIQAAGAPDDAVADPWEGHTLEWATASPPPPGNFTEALPPVLSPAPLLDARAAVTSEVV